MITYNQIKLISNFCQEGHISLFNQDSILDHESQLMRGRTTGLLSTSPALLGMYERMNDKLAFYNNSLCALSLPK